jgi:hypothetical protein
MEEKKNERENGGIARHPPTHEPSVGFVFFSFVKIGDSVPPLRPPDLATQFRVLW